MDDFPTRIADLLESVAARVRAMTVDRIAKAVRWLAAAPLLLVLGVVGLIFLLIGLARIAGELVGVRLAYAILGGLLLAAAVFLWSKRNPKSEEEA